MAEPGQTCPMHHQADPDDGTCKMRNVCARGDSALLTLTGGHGVLPPPTIGVIVFTAGDPLASLTASALLRGARPDAPPPRV